MYKEIKRLSPADVAIGIRSGAAWRVLSAIERQGYFEQNQEHIGANN
jgi:hypothetical protein